MKLRLFSGCSGEEGPVAGEGGQGPASEGKPAGGPPEEAGGAEAEGREASRSAGGEAETETRKEQGQKTHLAHDVTHQNRRERGMCDDQTAV